MASNSSAFFFFSLLSLRERDDYIYARSVDGNYVTRVSMAFSADSNGLLKADFIFTITIYERTWRCGRSLLIAPNVLVFLFLQRVNVACLNVHKRIYTAGFRVCKYTLLEFLNFKIEFTEVTVNLTKCSARINSSLF